MVNYFAKLATLAAVVLPLIFAAPTNLKLRNADATDVIENSYIVIYNTDVTAEKMANHLASVSSIISKRDSTLAGVGATYEIDDFKGFQVEADEAAIAEIIASPDVAYVEKDIRMYASALISHRTPGGSSYIYDTSAGSGVTVYVVDTGIYTAHSQFGGRATFGANYISGSPNTDENGHGTHCSGTIAGSTYGVAKAAKLVAVKVLDADGSGTNSGVMSGINYVANNAVSGKSVLSMSLGGSFSSALNSAVASAVSRGVVVAVAAGNDGANAANYSPASESSALTIGAVDNKDTRPSFSNFGSLVDVFAPGVDVLSSWIGGTTATNTISGTSMATPHVAGLAAYLIALEGLSTPAAVASRITALATTGKISNPGSGSPNRVLYNGNGA
ncbi:hypothetical protein B7494_g4801 [Chlorociboria aeruginascens]|nr:hypothetical protein B7494_g4801 [Chlorociboria aeruginascens]